MPVDSLVSATFAPTTRAPLESRTVPLSVAVTFWAASGHANRATTIDRASIHLRAPARARGRPRKKYCACSGDVKQERADVILRPIITYLRKLVLPFLALSAAAPGQIMRGRVVMPDGSPPPERAIIERICPGVSPMQKTVAGRHGEFFWRVPDDSVSVRAKVASVAATVPCVLRARVRKMESEGLDTYDPQILRSLHLPPLVLHPLPSPPAPSMSGRPSRSTSSRR